MRDPGVGVVRVGESTVCCNPQLLGSYLTPSVLLSRHAAFCFFHAVAPFDVLVVALPRTVAVEDRKGARRHCNNVLDAAVSIDATALRVEVPNDTATVLAVASFDTTALVALVPCDKTALVAA